MRKGALYFLIGGLFSVFVFSIYLYHIKVMADELEDEANEIIYEADGYLSSLEEDQEESDQVLSDNIGYIKEIDEDQETYEVYSSGYTSTPRLLSSSSDEKINVYDPTVFWQFDQIFFYHTYTPYTTTFELYIFKPDQFGDNTAEMISAFYGSLDSNSYTYKDNYGVSGGGTTKYYRIVCSSGIQSGQLRIYMQTIFNDNLDNYDWYVPEPDPTPEPDEPVEPDMNGNNTNFEIMVIFCFGLCAGVIVGHFLTGFIK